MIAIDTNLLVYAHRAGTSEHKAAKKAIEAAVLRGMGWGIAMPCIAEFWSVVTHPSCKGGPSKPSQARKLLDALLVSGGGSVWGPERGFAVRFLKLAETRQVNGPRILDRSIRPQPLPVPADQYRRFRPAYSLQTFHVREHQ